MRSGVQAACAIALVAQVSLTSCGAPGKFLQLNFMPAPEVYDESFHPLTDATPIRELPYQGILYATDRLPAVKGSRARFYEDERGGLLRLGVARVSVAEEEIAWEEIKRISLLKERPRDFPIEVVGVEEFGPLDRSATEFVDPSTLGPDPAAAGEKFATAVNAQLARSDRKHVYVYVHGYKVVFENPVLVATELWHFMGNDGVFIAYAWPSTPKRIAYLKDTETAAGFARNFRLFLKYLAEETDAEEIHVIGYSAGTRLVARTMEQLALLNHGRGVEEIAGDLRIGHVILLASDVDRQVFGAYLADGLLNVPRHLSVYISEQDKALNFSRFVARRERLGQMWSESPLSDQVSAYIYQNEAEVSVINVTGAESADTGNGHAYFRKSPWASSDVLMTLKHDLTPEQRGLIRAPDSSIWTFPPDYIDRLRAVVRNASAVRP